MLKEERLGEPTAHSEILCSVLDMQNSSGLNKLQLQSYKWMSKFPQGFLGVAFVYFAISTLHQHHFLDA